MTTLAAIVVASERRRAQVVDHIVPSLVGFNDAIVVGDWPDDDTLACRYACVAPITHTTTDALIKRDVGTLMTDADVLVYVCDDHALAFGFADALRVVALEPWDVLVPNRVAVVDGVRIPLNMGEREGYCGGHGGIFRRYVIADTPWSAGPHDRLWDLHMSQLQQERGWRFVWNPRAELTLIDLEPEHRPWT